MRSKRFAIGILGLFVVVVSFVSTSSISHAAPAVDPVKSTVVASPTSLTINGIPLTQITVSAIGVNGKPVIINSVALTPNPSTGLITVAYASGNPPPPSSQAIFYYGSTVPQQVTFTAVVNGVTLQQQAIVNFTGTTALIH